VSLVGFFGVVFAAFAKDVGADVQSDKLTKADKPNTIQYYVYDYQDKRCSGMFVVLF
jgi:hypothetical protein